MFTEAYKRRLEQAIEDQIRAGLFPGLRSVPASNSWNWNTVSQSIDPVRQAET